LLFKQNKENDIKYIYTNTLRQILIKKYNINNSFKLKKLMNIKIYFSINNIKKENIDFLRLWQNLQFIFLLSGKLPSIKKINYNLRRGIYYYRIVYETTIINENTLYEFIDFFFKFF